MKRYPDHIKKASIDDLLDNTKARNPRLIESQIIDYIMSLRKGGQIPPSNIAPFAKISPFPGLNPGNQVTDIFQICLIVKKMVTK